MAKNEARDRRKKLKAVAFFVPSPPPVPLAEALRRRIRELRQERGWTQDELGGWASAHGLAWTRDTASHVEDGSRAVSFEEVLVLLRVFKIGLSGLFPDDHPPLELSRAHVWEPAGLVDILNGVFQQQDEDEVQRWQAEDEEAAITRLAEVKAAQALGVGRADLNMAARRLWGRGLTAERDRRLAEATGDREVSARSRQAMRGHVTRQLLAELSQTMRKGKKR
jgi:transcriptional regulator with XRE-family HTH domain